MECNNIGEFTGEVKCLSCVIKDACIQAAMAWDEHLRELEEQRSELEELIACYEHPWKEGKQ